MVKLGFQSSFNELQNYTFSVSSNPTQQLVMKDLLNDFFYTMIDESHYSKMLAGINSFLEKKGINNKKKSGGARILITLPDGSVVLDTNKTNNTYANYKSKLINENHNSRVSIMSALLGNSGLSFEDKYSTSSGNFEQYMAVRVGPVSSSPGGVIRLSYVRD